MATTIIKPGYRLSVTSWENDGDHRRTEVRDGLTKEQAMFWVDICKLHYSRNNFENKGFGNLFEPNTGEQSAYAAAVTGVLFKHPAMIDTLGIELNADAGETLAMAVYDAPLEFAYEVGLAGTEGQFTRVLESFTVELVPIQIELLDVTSEFM